MGVIDIVVTGDRVVAANSDSWQPFSHPEELEYFNETTLKVIHTDSYSAEGELVHFKLDNGKVKHISYNGITMWPEKEWFNKQKNRKVVGPPQTP